MRRAIDVVFLDDDGTVIEIRHSVRPLRFCIGPKGSRSVLELPAGHAREIGLAAGDGIVLS